MQEIVTTSQMLRIALTRDGRAWRLAACTFGLIISSMGAAAIPILTGQIIDRALIPLDLSALVQWLCILAVVFAIKSIAQQRSSLGMVRVYGHGEHDLRQLAVGRVLHPRLHKRHATGEVLSIATNDTYQVAGVAWSIVQQLSTVAGLITASVALLLISVPLGIGVLVGAVVVLVVMQWLSRPMFSRGRTEQAAVAAASDIATDAMEGLRIIQGLRAEGEITKRYRKASEHSRNTAVDSAVALRLYDAVSEIVSLLYLAVLVFAAGWLTMRGDISAGELVTVIGLAQYLKNALAHIGTFGANWSYKRASAKRLRDFLSEDFLLPDGTSPTTSTSPPVLRWRTLEATPGKLLGIRVADAAMARTISQQLAFTVAPQPGELSLNGIDARVLGPQLWRQHVIAPPHDATLFSGTLKDNLLIDATLHPAITAATALDDVIDHLGSVEELIGEGGHRLSGGQRQRVLLARAMHTNADQVLVLDEPTTALDPVTARDVASGISELVHSKNQAVVVITSDRLLLEACDEVVEL
ncbi:ABC transporter permease [Corynebacterium suranareeae]|uniref:ABC transporter permease n=1 Tax=Corynebacterium suranareeae TaxID=2506452 RepID=A0A160PLJ8_9CORY|nr:ABC transporter ATP-binding protein [Corynebacterium suranareeae]BAU94529.1 ABC transporter permease [Corynebacterium suranareeae]